MSNWALAPVALTLIGLCAATPAQALSADPDPKADVPTCLITLAAVRSPLRFADFPAIARPNERWRRPLMSTADAMEFRTMLREATSEPPNFAGHYTIAVWGCGSSCTDFGIVDRQSGRVFFNKRSRTISGVHVASAPGGPMPTFNSLQFRQDSRLLVVLGAPNEDVAREGVTFLEWTGEKLVQLRFVRRDEACKPFP